jgi:hypothetical protein
MVSTVFDYVQWNLTILTVFGFFQSCRNYTSGQIMVTTMNNVKVELYTITCAKERLCCRERVEFESRNGSRSMHGCLRCSDGLLNTRKFQNVVRTFVERTGCVNGQKLVLLMNRNLGLCKAWYKIYTRHSFGRLNEVVLMHTALNFKLCPRFKICKLPSYGLMNMHNPTVAVFKVASFKGFTVY